MKDKVSKELEKALRALNAALEIIEKSPEYQNSSSIFHASTVYKYNSIVTAALTINESQIF